MSDSGWVNETHPKIPDAVIKAVVHELEGKRGISDEGLTKFIESLRSSWSTAFRPSNLVDTEMTNYRLEQVKQGARDVVCAMQSLSKALNALDQHEHELLEDQIGPLGEQISFLDHSSADAVAEAAEGLARDFVRSRGGYGSAAPDSLVNEATDVLRLRIVRIDNPPATFGKSDRDRVRNTAARLSRALREFPDTHELLMSLSFECEPELSELDLYRWLERLERINTATWASPVRGYRFVIKALADLANDQGVSVAKNGGGPFARFLGAIEDTYPGLIFPNSTRRGGRTDYIRRALCN